MSSRSDYIIAKEVAEALKELADKVDTAGLLIFIGLIIIAGMYTVVKITLHQDSKESKSG